MEQNLAYIAFALTLAVAAFVFWIEFYRKRPDITKVVEFDAPKGMTSADIGYVIDGAVDSRDVLSLIPWFEGNGYLKIEGNNLNGKDSDGTTTNMQLRKLKDLPESANEYERTLFNAMFPGSKTVFNIKYKYDAKFADAWSDAQHEVEDHNRNIMFEYCKYGGWALALLVVMFCVTLVLTARDENGELEWGCIVFPMVFMGCAFASIYVLTNEIKGKTIATKFKVWLIPIGCMAMSAMGIYVAIDYGSTSILPRIWVWILLLIICVAAIFSPKMVRPTEHRIRLLGLLLGLKEYIATAEKNELQQLATNNPSKFYTLLSFAIAFGLAPTWEKKFRGLNMMVHEFDTPD